MLAHLVFPESETEERSQKTKMTSQRDGVGPEGQQQKPETPSGNARTAELWRGKFRREGPGTGEEAEEAASLL